MLQDCLQNRRTLLLLVNYFSLSMLTLLALLHSIVYGSSVSFVLDALPYHIYYGSNMWPFSCLPFLFLGYLYLKSPCTQTCQTKGGFLFQHRRFFILLECGMFGFYFLLAKPFGWLTQVHLLPLAGIVCIPLFVSMLIATWCARKEKR